MARTIKLKESDLTKIVRRISEQQLITEKWDWAKLKRDLKNIASWVGIFNGIFSDSRLKKNITRVGKSPSGIPIYEWEYKNKVRFGGGTYRGVLAEHTPKKAVRLQSNGYKSVNYNMIDVAFEKVNSNNKKIKLSERDLTNVIKKVLNEKLYEPLDDRMGGPGGTFPDNPFDDDGFGGHKVVVLTTQWVEVMKKWKQEVVQTRQTQLNTPSIVSLWVTDNDTKEFFNN